MKSATLAALLILPFLTLAAYGAGPNPQGAEPSGTPTVTVLKNQRMLVVVSKGDPEKAGDAALKSLYREYFLNATEAEKNAPIAPRVRWAISAPDIRKKDWIGKYALPVSAEFPAPAADGAVIEEWRYGLTAELLHVGGPASKPAAIESLKGYIARNGFVIAGDFEEEFVQGKATFFQGRPENHRTILRFPILGIQDFPIATMPLSSAPRVAP
jgi:hypothetical protein